MEVEIGRDKLILSERTARDVLDLSEYHEKHKSNTPTYNLVVMATVIESSLRATMRNLSWYRFFEKHKYKKYKTKYLLEKLPQSKLLDLYQKIFELEGIDIKKKVMEVQSQESLQEQ